MANCRIVNESVASAVADINNIASAYAQAGTALETSFKAALADMEGDAKDALIDFFDTKIKDFVTSMESGLPAMVKGMAELLEANRANFENVDAQIAASIRG
jgi:hypothetical protein